MTATNELNAAGRLTPTLTECPEWRTLQQHCKQIERRHLRDLFAQDSLRPPGNEMLREYGFTIENVCVRARALLGKLRETSS